MNSSVFARAVFRIRSSACRAVAVIRTLWWGLPGMNVGEGTLLPKIHVTWPHQVSIAAGAVVRNSIPSYEIWGGVPARKIGERPL